MNPADLKPSAVLNEARAVFAIAESPIRQYMFLRELLVKLERDVADEVRRGATPLTPALADALFADFAAAIHSHPSTPSAALALDRAIAEIEREEA